VGVRKITVSLPPGLADSLDKDAASKGESVSSWIADAVERKLRRKVAREVLREFESTHGALTRRDKEKARKLWPD